MVRFLRRLLYVLVVFSCFAAATLPAVSRAQTAFPGFRLESPNRQVLDWDTGFTLEFEKTDTQQPDAYTVTLKDRNSATVVFKKRGLEAPLIAPSRGPNGEVLAVVVGSQNSANILWKTGQVTKLPFYFDEMETFTAALWVIRKSPSIDLTAITVKMKNGTGATIVTNGERYVIYDRKFHAGNFLEAAQIDAGKRTLVLGDESVNFDNLFDRNSDLPRNSEHVISAEYNLLPAAEQDELPSQKLQALKQIYSSGQTWIANTKQKVFGQDEMIDKLLSRLIEWHTLRTAKPFVGVITGPSGVGKTYTASILAKQIFNDADHFLELDGTEFMAPMNTSSVESHKLFGAPPAYQGKQKGLITEFMKKNDGSGLIVINEGDKMHPDYWTRLMELFDRGVVTSGEGETLQAKNLIILITSNRGARLVFPSSIKDWSDSEVKKRMANLTEDEIKGFYMQKLSAKDEKMIPEEVVKRIDGWFMAGPLTTEAAVQIAQVAYKEAHDRALSEYGLDLEFNPDVIKHLALSGYKLTDDGRQISRQVVAYVRKVLFAAAKDWNPPANSKIIVTLAENAEGNPVFHVESPALGQSIEIAAPHASANNPLHDPDVLAKLDKLNAVLKKRIIGQDDAVKSVEEIITAHFGNAHRKRPASIALFGSTGTGKTEMARAIAEAMYGSAERAFRISMGEVHDEANFNKIFGSDPGYIGSDVEREFEKGLKANPEGGVIVFDEFSNMGGKDLNMKETLVTKLYDILEEGSWTSSVTGKTYDLKKYVFVLTGNDMEEHFRNVTSDDMRLAIWKRLKSRASIRSELLKNGLKEALINRLGDVILMKPLLTREIDEVVAKLMDSDIKNFEKNNPGFKVTYSDTFKRRMSEAFFSQDKGARSVRDIIEYRFASLLTTLLRTSGINLRQAKDYVIQLGLTDNKTAKPYVTKRTPERKVILSADITKDGQTVAQRQLDVTEFATEMVLMTQGSAKQVAFHEAGHAVVNHPEITNEIISFVTIRGGKNGELKYYGYARYEPVDGIEKNPNLKTVIAHIAQLLAGGIAQQMAGFELDAGWRNDLEKAKIMATRAIVEWGLDPDFVGVKLDKDGNPIFFSDEKRKLFEDRRDAMVKKAEAVARQYLSARWGLVRAVAARLYSKGQINRDEFESIKNKYDQWVARGQDPRTKWTYDDYQKEDARRLQKANKPAAESCDLLLKLVNE